MRAGMLRRLGEWRASLQRSRYLSWIYLFFIALFFLAPTSKSHHQVYYVLVCVPYLLAFRPRGMLTLFRSWTYTLSFLYLGLLALSVAWSDQPSLQAFRRYAFHFAYTLLFLTMTVELVLQDRRLLTHLFRIIMFAAAAGGLISLVAFYSQASSPFERLRALGVLDDPNSAAAVFGSVLLVAYYWGVREGERPVWRALAWFSLAVSLAFVIMTQTRGELLALLTTVIVGAFIVRDATVEKWTAAILFLIAAGFMALAMMDAPFIPPDLTSRGLSYRPEIWSIAFDFVVERPLMGHGQSFRPEYQMPDGRVFYTSHSIYLGSLLWVGVTGTALLGALCISALRWSSLELEGRRSFAITAVLIHSMICMFFDGHKLLGNPREIWFYFWLPVAISVVLELRRKGLCRGLEG